MIERDFLEREYVQKNRTAIDIAKEIGKSDTQVRYWINKHNLPMKARGGGKYTIDLKGKRFGKLIVLEQTEQIRGSSHHCARWICRCDCGKIKVARASSLKVGDTKSCGSRGCKMSWRWKGFGELSGTYFLTLQKSAAKRNLEFKIDKEYLWNLFLEQDRKCALSGIELYFTRCHSFNGNRSTNTSQTASLDRISPKIGYTKDNVQWIHKDLNRIKREYDEDIFLNYVQLVAEHKMGMKLKDVYNEQRTT